MTIYVALEDAIAIHADQIATYGGSPGLRDEGLLLSALLRPQTGYYGDLIEEAAALWESLSMNHAFIDGNKRTGFVAAELFLRLNGYQLTADDADCVLTMLAVAAGDVTEDEFADWLRRHSVPRV